MSIYHTGYVYIWRDNISKFFYIGGHFGQVDDYYICSSKPMLRAYKKRPETFKFKVLEYCMETKENLRICEQKWLDKIKDSELMTSENVKNGKCRYYNVKKSSSGGNGQANKGKSHVPWNKGLSGKQVAWNKGLNKDYSESIRRGALKTSKALKGRIRSSEHNQALKNAYETRKSSGVKNKKLLGVKNKKQKRPKYELVAPDNTRLYFTNFREIMSYVSIGMGTLTCALKNDGIINTKAHKGWKVFLLLSTPSKAPSTR